MGIGCTARWDACPEHQPYASATKQSHARIAKSYTGH